MFTLSPSKHTSWPPYMCTGISAAHSVGLSDQQLLCSAIVQSVSESRDPGEWPRDKEHNRKGLTLRPLRGTGVSSEVFHIGPESHVPHCRQSSRSTRLHSSCRTTISYCYLLVDSYYFGSLLYCLPACEEAGPRH